MQAQIKLKQGLAGPLGQLQTTARMIAEVQAECKLPVVPDEYVESFKPDLMDVIFSWSKVTEPSLANQRLDCVYGKAEGATPDLHLPRQAKLLCRMFAMSDSFLCLCRARASMTSASSACCMRAASSGRRGVWTSSCDKWRCDRCGSVTIRDNA